MKHFIYCESTDGGMEVHEYEFENKNITFALLGWMSKEHGCETSDEELVKWVKSCKIGDFFNHRMGTCICVNPQ